MHFFCSAKMSLPFLSSAQTHSMREKDAVVIAQIEGNTKGEKIKEYNTTLSL